MKPTDQMLSLTIVAKILLHTIDHPIKSKEIEQTYGISGVTVREIVHDARLAGHAIGSGGDGYFKCQSFAEWEPTRNHLHGRAVSILSTLKKVDETFAGQQGNIFQ